MDEKEIKKKVKEGYAKVAKQETTCCAPIDVCCDNASTSVDISKKIGYIDDQLKSVPNESNLGLGCGNPTAIASLKEGEIVLDLGSGAGFDCFLAANKVGKQGKVIGIDMTPEMIKKARENAEKGNYSNVEFRLGEIEKLPVENTSVDVIISNCVINLSPDKKQVFNEAYRTLKKGGRLVVSDIVLLKELPEIIKNSVEAYIGCISGAIMKDEYLQLIKEAGFKEITITEESNFNLELFVNDPTAQEIMKSINATEEDLKKLGDLFCSVKVIAQKIN
jgi:SAM-dependent methyltransferase